MIFIKNILQFKSIKVLTYLVLLLYVFLLGGKELFHNHESELFEPNDCPVYLLSLNSDSYTTDFLAINFINIFSDNFNFLHPQIALEDITYNNSPFRAPPFHF